MLRHHRCSFRNIIFIVLSLSIGLVWQNALLAEQQPLPTPLDLKTALSFAQEHPRTKLTADQSLLLPPPQPLFLGCHELIFNNSPITDPIRNSNATQLVDPVIQQELLILQAYFDVLLADSNLIGVNEDLAGSFIRYDRAKTRQELKQYSELYVAKLDAEYQIVRQQFFAGQATQRLTRSVLAQSINHPNDLSSDLTPASLIQSPKTIPDANALYQQALKNNGRIKKISENSNKEQAALYEMALQQQILEMKLRLDILAAAADRAEANAYSKDLNLELSRSLYEMEVKASLGNSMTEQSKARMEEERVKYCRTLTWAKLNALTGKPILTQPKVTEEENQ
jgi:hypothetical protein